MVSKAFLPAPLVQVPRAVCGGRLTRLCQPLAACKQRSYQHYSLKSTDAYPDPCHG
jgi:hypothetical protein